MKSREEREQEKIEKAEESNIEYVKNDKLAIAKKILLALVIVIFLPFVLLYYLVKGIIKIIKYKRWKKEGLRGKLLLLSADITDIDIMEGYEFESYLSALFFYEGYSSEITTKAKDYGADVILTKGEEKIIVQAKRYSKPVGVKSVQEIMGATKHYNATGAMVVTNSRFTEAAETIAKENNIRLVDRDELIEIYKRVKKQLNLSTKESDFVNKENLDINDKFPYSI